MNKQEFHERLKLAGEVARKLATNYVIEDLPEELCFTISRFDDSRGRPVPPGTIKFLGGRLMNADDLKQLPAGRAASLLWIDGKVPSWINLGVKACDDTKTELFIMFSGQIVPANENELFPDVGCAKGNGLIPFRIRGPFLPPAWRSAELDGRFSLMAFRGPPD